MSSIYEVTFSARKNADIREAFDLSPADLSDASFRMLVKDSAGTTKATLTSDNGGIVVSAADSQITIVIEASTLSEWDAGEYDHDLLMVDGDATTTLFYGRIELTEGIS